MKRPTDHQMETTLRVLLWFHEESEGDGQLRDSISLVRHELSEVLDA